MRNTNHVVSRGLLGLAALAALGVAAPARADVIYNNFGAGDTYGVPNEGGWPIFGSTASLRGRVDEAGTFTTGADGYNNLVFEGAFSHNRGTPGVTMRLMGNAGGLPDEGAVLATSPSLIPSLTPGILTWTLDPSVTLAANTRYWFAASATHPDGRLDWMQNNTGQMGLAQREGSEPWSSLDPAIFRTPAFRVSGSVLGGGGNGGGGAVPEPSEWAAMGVLGLALGGLVVRRRRAR